jgi:tRNA (adenine22-N1)-methyltransferase
MQLDSRLSAVAGLVRKNKTFADIGTDHAYRPVYLVENHIINNAIAADLRKGPLENAKETVVAHNLSDKISLRLSDGLDNFNENEVQEIAVAGMGGLLIAEFIERTEWLKNKDIHLILQPMTHAEELRKTLFDNGFIIDCEKVAVDGDKLYIIISAYYNGIATVYNNLDLIVGRLPLNQDENSLKYLNHLFDKYNKKLVALKNADKECTQLEKIVEELKKWQQ